MLCKSAGKSSSATSDFASLLLGPEGARHFACLYGMAGKTSRCVRAGFDAGANVGFSRTSFLWRFPSCMVIAVESDAADYKALQRNFAPHRDRVQLYNFDIWSKSVDLMIEAPGYRDGRDWTRQVPKRAAGEHPHIQAITIDDLIDSDPIDANLIENSGLSKLSLLKKGFLLKMDIADQTAGR